jgi:hypothetical protein
MLVHIDPRNRFEAAAIHFALSLLVAVVTFTLIRLVWFPGPLFSSAGGLKLFALIAGVDVTLGPLLTLTVYVPGKWGLRFDLIVIATLQVGALIYGSHVLFESRPVYIAFVKDRFELVRAEEVADADLAKAAPGYRRLPLGGPRIVAARLPTDPTQKFNIMLSGIAGKDVQTYPQYYLPYDEVRAEVRSKCQPIADLRALNPTRLAEIDRALRRLDHADRDTCFLPVRAGARDLAALVDARDGRYLGLMNARPWKY